jgi:hypothetical protein
MWSKWDHGRSIRIIFVKQSLFPLQPIVYLSLHYINKPKINPRENILYWKAYATPTFPCALIAIGKDGKVWGRGDVGKGRGEREELRKYMWPIGTSARWFSLDAVFLVGLSRILLLQPKRLTHSHTHSLTHSLTHQVAVLSHCVAVASRIEPRSGQRCFAYTYYRVTSELIRQTGPGVANVRFSLFEEEVSKVVPVLN